MPSFENLLMFFAATAVFAYMPGPSTLYAAAQTISGGRRAGGLAALGIHVGGYVHVVAAVLGISALFTAVPALYWFFKLIGAGYLVWLGLQMLRAQDDLAQIAADANQATFSRRTFWQSATVEILNPKTALFYIAFLPQFTDPAAALPLWGQLLILGTLVNIMFSSADVLCVLLSTAVLKFFRESPAGSRIAQRIGGSILVGLGINLAFARQ